MKKNITINLCGSLYAIDEDACEVLEQYLQNMQRYFGRRDGGDEIVDDIEHRVAELFAELKAQGVEAINIEHVRDIISRIGNPEEMDDGEADADAAPEQPQAEQDSPSAEQPRYKSWFAGRRLFRDPDDKVLGGVISGLSKFCGSTDPLPWRIIFIALLCFSFSTAGIVYLIAWALIPVAQTAEDRLKMRGRPVNPETLNEELMRGATRAGDYLRSDGFRSTARGFFGSLSYLIGWCFKLLSLFVIGAFILASVVTVGMLLFVCYAGPDAAVGSGLIEREMADVLQQAPAMIWMSWGALLSGLLLLGILFYVLVRSLLHRPTDEPMRPTTRVTLLVLAVLSFASCLTLGVFLVAHYDRVERDLYTQNGIYIPRWEQQILAESGWEVSQIKGCNGKGYFLGWTDCFDDEEGVHYLKFERDKGARQWSFNAVRSEELPEGDYHLEALTEVDGMGAKIFRMEGKERVFTAVPPTDLNDNGNIVYMDSVALSSIAILPASFVRADSLNKLCDEADDWSWVRSPTFHHPGGVITYGFTGSMRSPASEAELYRIAVVPENKTQK